jgi:hypothetical protein
MTMSCGGFLKAQRALLEPVKIGGGPGASEGNSDKVGCPPTFETHTRRFGLTQVTLWRIGVAPFSDSSDADAPTDLLSPFPYP